jgi:hypothetical protein
LCWSPTDLEFSSPSFVQWFLSADYLFLFDLTIEYVCTCVCGCICHRTRCACHCKHTSIDTRWCICNGTIKHLGGAQPTARMFYTIVSTNLSSLFLFFSCSVQWHFMLKQWEPPSPSSTIFSRATNYFDGGWPLLPQGISWWYFSSYTHTHIYTYSMVKWATERTWASLW